MTPTARKPSIFLVLTIAIAAIAAPAIAQKQKHTASRPGPAPTSRPESRTTPWAIVPPKDAASCPSIVASLDCPKELYFGEIPLAASRDPVVDGDTIRLEGHKESVRFIGIDAEETFKDPAKRAMAEANFEEYRKTELAGHPAAHPPKYATFMGEAAKDFMHQMLAGVKTVRLEYDEPSRVADVYGRGLFVVLVQKDGAWWNLNVELVRQGLSPYFTKYGRSRRWHERFLAAQQEAVAAERGIWGSPGTYAHYNDYAARLKWWNERDAVLEEALKAAPTRPDLALLGHDADWKRLLAAQGHRMTVLATPGARKAAKGLVLFTLPHAKGEDFVVAGSADEIAKLALEKEDGNYVYLTGTVEIYKGKPEFKAGSVTLSRTLPPPAPAGTDSAPAPATPAPPKAPADKHH